MARVRQIDAQHAVERVHKRTPRRVGAQVTDNRLFHASSDEFQVAATERWEAALKIADRAASGHPCELDPAAGITECLHPDHEQDAEWAAIALDILGLPGDDLLDDAPVPLEDYAPPSEPEQNKPRFERTKFTRTDLNWQDRAICKGEEAVLFFGRAGESWKERELREEMAAEVCEFCPVKARCLEYAFELNQKDGVWGGVGEEPRKALRRRWVRRKANAA